MTDRLALLADQAVRSAVERELGRAIEYHVTLPSTQDRARELDRPAAVVADHQTAGRGKRDRVWSAAPGTSLLASWVYQDGVTPLAALVAGVAVARALDALGRPDARLKWPNDVQLAGRKVAGALAHARTGDVTTLVVGIGVNVAQAEGDFPAELRGAATSLALQGGALDRLALFVRITRELDGALKDVSAALDEWRARSAVLGREVLVLREGEAPLRGVARGLDDDGALILEIGARRERVAAGEVSLREARV